MTHTSYRGHKGILSTSIPDSLLSLRFVAETQEDRIVAVPDLNVHVPEASRSELDSPRSFFCVFDGRECSRTVGIRVIIFLDT